MPRDVQDDWNQEGEQNDAFVVYKGEKHLLEDFTSVSGINDRAHPFREEGWDGYISDTFFSGILLKWVPGSLWEQVIMGRYYA